MMSFWNDPDGFSVKDLLGILLGLLFFGISIFSILTNDEHQRNASLEIVKTISPIIITIVGGYAVSEGAKGVIHTYHNTQKKTGDDEMKKNSGGGEI